MSSEMQDIVNQRGLVEFFGAYGKCLQFETFFEQYRAVVSPSGRLRTQNFLVGSELVREWEERWCRVLRWLLDPDACATLAPQFQRAFCKRWTNATLSSGELLTADREVCSGNDRFDITLTSDRNWVLIEAKVNAVYDESQHERYQAKLPEHGYGVYVTRRPLNTAGWGGRWVNCTWHDVVDLLEQCLAKTADVVTRLDEQRWKVVAQDFVDLIKEENHA